MEITFKSDIPVELLDHMGGDASIAKSAWVSTGADKSMNVLNPSDTIKGVINYLMKHRHGTPFEHNSMTFRVHAPIFVWREWHRHRIGFSYNEESGRYKTLDPIFYMPPKARPMFKVDNWKPGRPKFLKYSEFESLHEQQEAEANYNQLISNLKESYTLSYRNYEKNNQLGIDPGLARDCLPVGIFSMCWVTANARSIMAFLSLRTHEPDARDVSYPLWEIDQAARKLEMLFAEHFPLTHMAFNANGRVAP